jgi:hypothetical protein
MQTLILLLRAIHITAGVFWAGFVLAGAVVTFPRLRSMGAEGASLSRAMVESRASQTAFAVSAFLTVIAGLLLFWLVYGFAFPWSVTQWAFALGGLSALLSPFLGPVLGRLITPATSPDAGPESREFSVTEQRVRGMAVLLTVAVLLMATARYLT